MYALTRALRAVWWRRGVSAALVAVAALTVAAAVVAPLYVRSAGAAALADTLAGEPAGRTGIALALDVTDNPARAATVFGAVPRRPTLGYPAQVRALVTDAELRVAGRPAVPAGRISVMWRDGACAHLTLVSGRCPAQAGEVLIGAAAGRRLGWRLGDVLRLPRGEHAGAPLTVVGTYLARSPDGGYWLGVDFHPVDALASAGVVSVEPAFVTAATLDRTWIVGPVHRLADRTRNLTTLVTDRTGACARLSFVSGSCPAGESRVAVSEQTARQMGWPVGTVLELPTGPFGAQVTVSGIYRRRDPRDPFWSEQRDAPDAIFATASALASAHSSLSARALLPFDGRVVTVDKLPALSSSVDRVLTAASAADTKIESSTSVLDVLAGIDRNQRTLLTLVLLIAGQLTILAWFVLYLVVSAASDARGNEVALAKMRGLGWLRTAGFGVAEPMLLLVLGAPLGLLLAMAVTSRLVPAVSVAVGWPALAAGGVALAGGGLAVLLGARRTLTRPVLEQWRRSGDDRAADRAFSGADGVVVALTLAGLYELRSGTGLKADQRDAVSLLGPALLTVLIATLGVRLLPLACRLAIRRTRTSPRIGAFVAVRQVARRPAGLRLAALLAVAVSLTLFAVYAGNVAAHNRLLRARTEIGADRVLTVAPGRADLEAVVRRLDPRGRAAMAAARVPDTGGTGRGSVLAVDSPRLAAVASWPDASQGSAATVARRLAVPTPRPLVIEGTQLRLRLTADAMVAPDAQPSITISLRTASGNEVSVPFGRLRAGVASATAPLRGCSGGCRLTGLAMIPGPREPAAVVSTSFLGLDQRTSSGPWVSMAIGFGDPGRWSLQADGSASPETAVDTFSGQLQLRFANLPGDNPPLQVSYTDRSAPLPTLPTRRALGAKPYPTLVTGLDNTGLPATRVGIAGALPGVGSVGTLVDLTAAQRRVTLGAQAALATYQVWLSAAAPADFPRRLAAAGIAVLRTETVAGRQRSLAQQGPALALRLFLIAALGATVLAAGATAIATYLSARRRAFELAALTAVGFGRSTLLRACLAEQGLLLGWGVSLGVLSGVAGSRLALPSIPLYADASPLPTVFTADLPLLAGVVLALIAALGLTAAAASVLLVRSAHPERLREAAP